MDDHPLELHTELHDDVTMANVSTDLPSHVHIQLDNDVHFLSNLPFVSEAAQILSIVIGRCARFYADSKSPIVKDYFGLDACETLLASNQEIRELLRDAHIRGQYAEIRNRPEFHTRPTTPENATNPLDDKSLQHTATKSKKEVDDDIRGFIEKCRPKMRNLVDKARHVPSLIPSWKPGPSADKRLVEHASELCIPISSSREPSLLLHDLGEERSRLERERVARIPHIFSVAHHTVLINTSGSGKTRLVLEGLCSRWGFYFVAKPDSAHIGSLDLWQLMNELDDALDYKEAKKRLGNPNNERAVEHIREVAERRLAQLLLARFLLLDLLVQEARKVQGGLNEKEHRRLWVLLQAQPEIIFGNDDGIEVDIFTELAQLLRHTSIFDLTGRIRRKRSELSSILTEVFDPATGCRVKLPFFCVLDEVQVAATQRHGEFMSENKTTKRPVLREIWLLWSTILGPYRMRLVLSGTGIDLQALKDTLDSSACKEEPYDIVYDIGAFEDPESQAEYIKRYIPAPWIDQHWENFLKRAWGWFRGRYRSTATLISLILQAGYQCPHRTIDEYVEAYTDFRPNDGKNLADLEPQLPTNFIVKTKVTKLDFEKMNEMQASTLSDALYDQILYGCYSLGSFTSEQRDLFVKYGFARHKPGAKVTVIDEPLAILAALQWVNKSAKFSLFGCLRRDIQKHSKRKNGFEAYLAFHLRKVFETAPELDTVFTFRSDFAQRGSTYIPWQHENFELVMVVATADKSNPYVSVVTPSCGSSSNVGFLAASGKDVLDWISTNKDQFAFCFPPESFGPDLLFFVRSKVSGKLLLVMIQAKKYDTVTKADLVHGVRTVTPSWFWKSKNKEHPTAATAPFILKDGNECPKLAGPTQDALMNIPLGLTVERADYPVLRVFASWEGDAKLERTLHPMKTKRKASTSQAFPPTIVEQEPESSAICDPDPHPLATLHLKNFREVGEKLDENWFRGDVEQKEVVHPMRAREEPTLPSRARKRAKLETYYQ